MPISCGAIALLCFNLVIEILIVDRLTFSRVGKTIHCFNLVIEILIVDRVPGEFRGPRCYAVFQSRNRDSYR